MANSQGRSDEERPSSLREDPNLNVLDKLWELQKILSELADRERRLTVKPDDFAEIDQQYSGARAESARLEEKLEVLGKERRKLDGELQMEQELLKKYQGQLMQVKNQQQYSAAWKEIDVTRKKVKEIEEADLAKMAEIDEAQKQLDALLEQNAGLEAQYKKAHADWQDSLQHVRDEIAGIRAKSKDIEKGIPPGLLRQFQRIHEQRQGVAVAMMEGDACSECRFRVRSQAAIEILRGEIVTCEGCRRILYAEKPV